MIEKLQLAVVDTETTGLSPAKHEMIEIGILRVEQWFDGDVTYTKRLAENCYKIIPEQIDNADPIALKINGYTKEKWRGAINAKVALKKVKENLMSSVGAEGNFSNGLILIGHNIHFDVSFIVESFRKHNIDFEMNKRAIDTYSVALRAIGRNNQKSFSLGALCERFEIEYKDRHTAMGDVNATYEVYKKLFNIKEAI